MSQIIEVSQNDYGYTVEVILYRNDDTTVAENLSSASSISLDITRGDETPIVSDATVTISDPSNGVVQFTPLSTWFTDDVLGGRSHYIAVFKISYASGLKRAFPIPLYVHLS